MEPFFDGGLIELLIAIGIGYTLNFIFLKKYLLVFFSIVSIVAPVLLFYVNQDEIYYLLVGVCIFNTIFLNTLLWKQRLAEPDKPLFDLKKYIEQYRKKGKN